MSQCRDGYAVNAPTEPPLCPLCGRAVQGRTPRVTTGQTTEYMMVICEGLPPVKVTDRAADQLYAWELQPCGCVLLAQDWKVRIDYTGVQFVAVRKDDVDGCGV